MIRPFEEVLENYENIRDSYRNASKNGNLTKASLMAFQEEFVHLKADLRHWHSTVMLKAENRSDKAATAIKYRIAVAISEGEFVDDKGELIYDKCSITQAEKYAAASDKYKDFLRQRSFYKESLVNIVDIREDINSYILAINNALKYRPD